jgi:hypothetical protein
LLLSGLSFHHRDALSRYGCLSARFWPFYFIVEDYKPFMTLDAAPAGSSHYDLDSGNVTSRRVLANEHREGGDWLSYSFFLLFFVVHHLTRDLA